VKAFLRLVGKGERKKSYTTDDDLLPKEHPNYRAKEQATEQLAERYAHIDFSPPDGVRKAASRALEVRAEKPPSQRGMTDVGLARARDLSNGKTISPETARRMLAYFSRHEVDKKGSSWPEQGAGWQAWHGWGGDAGYAWARKLVRQMDAADQKLTERPTYQAAFGEIALAEVDGLVVVVDDGQTMGRPFVTLSAGKVSSRLSGDLICDVTPEHLAEIKRVFDARRGSDPVIIDWNHQSAPGGQSTPEESGALGEIAELRLSEDGRKLIAVPVYNQRGAEVVAAAGGTLWSSPEFFLGDVYARESGERTGSAQLLAITLTPRPQQAASALERVTLSEEMNLMDVAEIEAIADLDQAKALLKQKDALVRELEARLKSSREEMAEDEDDAEEMAEASSDDEEKKEMGEYKRMSEQLTQANSAQAAQIKALTEQVQALAEKEATTRREAAINALLRSGRITPAEREVAERAWALSESGDPTFLNWINERPAEHAVSLSEIGHGASGEEITQATVAQRAQELANSESISFTEAYQRINRDEPALIKSAFGGF
jgi:phage I-like protein